MSKYMPILKKIGLYLLISLISVTVIMGFSFLNNERNPTYESVPYTVEEAMVYVTNYGDCYRSSDCSYLHSSKIAIGRNKARNQGYYACSRCNGTTSETIKVTYYQQVEKDMTSKIIVQSIVIGLAISVVVFIFISKKEKQNSSN